MALELANGLFALVFITLLALFGWLMISRRLTATLALPLAALSIGIVALLPEALRAGLHTALSTFAMEVIEPGITRLSTAIMAVILGAVLAALMKLTGAAERLVRYAAEYAGEDRFRLGLLLLVVIAVLFTTLGGLGAVILVATVTLPLMFSLGFEPKAAGGLFLLGLSLGGCLNPTNWAIYFDVLNDKTNNIANITVADIVPFALTLALCFFLVTVAFLLIQVAGLANWRRQAWIMASLILIILIVGLIVLQFPNVWVVLKLGLAALILTALISLLALLVVRLALVLLGQGVGREGGWLVETDNWLTGAAVLVPLMMLLWSSLSTSLIGPTAGGNDVGILTALTAGIAYCTLASYTRDGATVNRLMRALFEGVTSGGPAVVLLIGIGLLLKATTLPVVVSSFQPLLQALPINTPLGYTLVFFILSPLALYRGPFNLWGMGSGVIGIISGIGTIGAGLVMAAFFSVGMLQGVCDPTNTHNVWIANFCKVPVADLTKVTIPWVLMIVLLGLIIGVTMFRAGFAI